MRVSPRDKRRATGRAVILVVLCAAAGGCATRPLSKLARPAFKMPARFARSGKTPAQNAWWRAFDDPALDALVARALSRNFNLQSAYARVKAARATVAAQRANLFPSLSGSVSESASREPNSSRFRSFGGFSGFSGFGSGASGSGASTSAGQGNDSGAASPADGFTLRNDRSQWRDSRSLEFSASYELDLFGRIRNGLKADELDARARVSALQSAAITLTGNIADDWYQYQEYRARVRLLKSQIKTNQNVLALTAFSFNNGQAAAADVLRQRQTVESTRGQLAQAKALATVEKHALAVLVGRSPAAFDMPAGKLVALPRLPATGVPAKLLMRRPDVRQRFFHIAADNRRVAVALADRYPHLSLSASYTSSTDIGTLLSGWILQLGAQLTQPLFDAGARAAAVRRSRAVVDQDVADYQETMLEALQEVDDALTNERRQKQYLAHLDKQLKLSQQVVANLRLRYLRGATNYLDVLNALLTRQRLQVNKLTGQRQLLDYRINLYRALAGGLVNRPLGRGSGPAEATTKHDMESTRRS